MESDTLKKKVRRIKLKTNKGEIELPCLDIRLVNIEEVVSNNYNPNNVSNNNMELLQESIVSNGFCFPVVTIWDNDLEKYIIIDGFHRYIILKEYLESKQIPIVVLNHDISQRMVATVQFNRARGVHQVELMGDLVHSLVKQGVDDDEIARRMGMEIEEVFRLKQITGIAELFKNQNYSKSWIMIEENKND